MRYSEVGKYGKNRLKKKYKQIFIVSLLFGVTLGYGISKNEESIKYLFKNIMEHINVQ